MNVKHKLFFMEAFLTKQQAVSKFAESIAAFKAFNLREPAFGMESLYLDFFHDLVTWLPEPKNGNISEFVQGILQEYLRRTIRSICEILDRHSIDGSIIWNLVNDGQIILRRDQQRYNRQLPGKRPKGIISETWHDYNHWLIACNLWKGCINGLKPSFSVTIPDSDDDIVKLLAPEIRSLWGMWEAYNKLGRPLKSGGNDGDAIYVKP